jgi:hypothetical protein
MKRTEIIYLFLLFSVTVAISSGFLVLKGDFGAIVVTGKAAIRRGESFSLEVPVSGLERPVLAISRGASLLDFRTAEGTISYLFIADDPDAVIVVEYNGLFKAKKPFRWISKISWMRISTAFRICSFSIRTTPGASGHGS